MLQGKEFYFVRHGQTDHNICPSKDKGDHTADIPLNITGRRQAEAIEPLIASLPLQAVAFSPMKRAAETKELITSRLCLPQIEIPSLRGTTASIWNEMRALTADVSVPETSAVFPFMEKVRKGMEQVFALPAPALLVAHGEIHFVVCLLMQIQEHSWYIDNCGIVRFFVKEDGRWGAQKL